MLSWGSFVLMRPIYRAFSYKSILFDIILLFLLNYCMSLIKTCMPSYKGDFNDLVQVFHDPALYETTNCLAMAMNCPEAGRAMPGQLIDVQDQDFPDKLITADKIMNLMIEVDGFIHITEEQALSGKFHCLALRLNKDERNFHFLGGSGETWYHKISIGTYLPDNRDDDGALITNPRTSYDHMHPEFGGYLAIPETGVKYKQVLSL